MPLIYKLIIWLKVLTTNGKIGSSIFEKLYLLTTLAMLTIKVSSLQAVGESSRTLSADSAENNFLDLEFFICSKTKCSELNNQS